MKKWIDKSDNIPEMEHQKFWDDMAEANITDEAADLFAEFWKIVRIKAKKEVFDDIEAWLGKDGYDWTSWEDISEYHKIKDKHLQERFRK